MCKLPKNQLFFSLLHPRQFIYVIIDKALENISLEFLKMSVIW